MGKICTDKSLMPLWVLLAVALAGFDYIVRTYTLGWTEVWVSQTAVFLSPLIYFGLAVLAVFRLRGVAQVGPEFVYIIAAILLIVFSAAVIIQVIYGRQAVGSATYSIVFPLFASGIPFSLLTFLVFFRQTRESLQSYLICLVCVFWLVMPIGIDTLYLTQGGYRGPGAFQVAVISTSYEFIQFISIFGALFSPIAVPIILTITIYRVFRASGIDRLFAIAVGCSILALSVQFVNWGAFVLD